MDLGMLFTRMAGEISQFSAPDFATIGMLALLEGILSVDNALVLAILVRQLPKKDQAKALTYGIAGAFIFRFLALIFASKLMELVIFKFVGGGYLLYLSMKHLFFFREEAYQQSKKNYTSLWRTVVVVELTDLAFSIDSITAAVAMTDKLAVVWIGGILGILCLRFSSKFFMMLLEKLPRMEDLAYQLIFFVGVKLTMEGMKIHIGHSTFWLVMGVIMVLGAALVYRDWAQRKHSTHYEDRLLEELENGQVTMEQLLAQPYIPGRVAQWLVEKGCVSLPAREPPKEAG